MSKEIYKTTEQIEFAEWLQKIEELGYKRRDVTQELHISKSAISMYLSGKSSPSSRTLAGIRQFAQRIQAAKQIGQELDRRVDSLDRLNEQLAYLEKNDPPSFEAARATIDALHKTVSSKPLSVDVERGLSAASAAKRLAQSSGESRKKHKAASPSENKPAPGSGGPSNPK